MCKFFFMYGTLYDAMNTLKLSALTPGAHVTWVDFCQSS